MFFSDPEKVTLSGVRRLVRNVGPENIWDLMKLRECDRVGTGSPKEQPYRLRKFQSMIEEALRAPVSVKKLAIGGAEIMELLHVKPGVVIGYVLHALLEEVLDDPTKDNKEYLSKRVIELGKLPQEQIRALGQAGIQRRGSVEQEEIKEIRDKYWVK
jgi:hypothetical protein